MNELEIRVLGSNKPGFVLPLEEAKLFAGHSAGICYMKDDFDAILAEPEEKTLKRFDMTVGSGHHSVAGHLSYNLLFTGIPKIIAMVLNNEKDYNTSEKSARYTKMKIEGEEKRLYDKWLAIFKKLIENRYPKIDEKTREKLAQENARYFISVFTPSTTMEYTVDLRQGNYLIGFLEDAAKPSVGDRPDSPFMERLKPLLFETAQLIRSVMNVEGLRDNRGRELSLFAKRYRAEDFGESYSVNYAASFAMLAQAQRHRPLNYEMIVPKLYGASFFIPPIIEDVVLAHEYMDDMESIKGNYPQGMLVHVNEQGRHDDLLKIKAHERLCGAAQLEVCRNTRTILERYFAATDSEKYSAVHKAIGEYLQKGTKCKFGHYICNRPCPLGPGEVFTRKI